MDRQEVPLPKWRTSLPRRKATELIASEIRTWVCAPPLTTLVQMWGGRPPLQADIYSLLAWLDDFTSEHWDYRNGRERNLARTAILSAEQESATLVAAEALGLATAREPMYSDYDAVIVLGGLVRACLVRPRYAAALLDGIISAKEIVGLGGFRTLGGDEVELARKFGVAGQNELDAMVFGIKASFQLAGPPHYMRSDGTGGNSDWEVVTYPDAPNVSVIAAPSSDSQRRANSLDTYKWWASRKGSLTGNRLLVITTTIYVPYQGAAAIQLFGLEYGAEVETIGVPASLTDLGDDTQTFTTANYLQELRSAVRGYHSLLTAATTTNGSDDSS